VDFSLPSFAGRERFLPVVEAPEVEEERLRADSDSLEPEEVASGGLKTRVEALRLGFLRTDNPEVEEEEEASESKSDSDPESLRVGEGLKSGSTAPFRFVFLRARFWSVASKPMISASVLKFRIYQSSENVRSVVC
jgi:hypothetical protein